MWGAWGAGGRPSLEPPCRCSTSICGTALTVTSTPWSSCCTSWSSCTPASASAGSSRYCGAGGWGGLAPSWSPNCPYGPQDLKGTLAQELDFENEGRNAERCARELQHFRHVVVPRVHWSMSSKVRWAPTCPGACLVRCAGPPRVVPACTGARPVGGPGPRVPWGTSSRWAGPPRALGHVQ